MQSIGRKYSWTRFESDSKITSQITKSQNHTSVLTIGEVCKKNPQFSFRFVDKDKGLKEILNLDASKACQDSEISSRIIKENADIFIDFLHSSFKNSIYQFEFPSILKLENITPAFKKDYRNSEKNYRIVSILSNISKIFE